MKKDDVESVVNRFHQKNNSYHRYASFDYCFNYFKTEDITKDIEKSCLVLGFYLASWGMYRGSSFMLQKSVKQLEKTIEYIAKLDSIFWKIDVDTYKENNNIEYIIEVYNYIRVYLIPKESTAHLTLITKVMLGVFGIVPAYDTYFTKTFKGMQFGKKCGFNAFNKNSLECIYEFYINNESSINNLSKKMKTLDFTEEKETKLIYPKAKIIDMYGFNLAFKK